MNHDELLTPIVRAVRKGTNLTGPDIRAFFADWECLPVTVEGEHVGTAVIKGTEIHFALVEGWRPKSCQRGAIKAFLGPLIERQGYLTTRVPHERLAQKKFVQRLGFQPTWRDEHVEYFMLGQVPFERKA
jgi:hypothetical protein